MLGEFRSLFIILVFEFIGNISYLSRDIFCDLRLFYYWFYIVYRSISKSKGNLSFRFRFSVICQVVQKILKAFSCL